MGMGDIVHVDWTLSPLSLIRIWFCRANLPRKTSVVVKRKRLTTALVSAVVNTHSAKMGRKAIGVSVSKAMSRKATGVSTSRA